MNFNFNNILRAKRGSVSAPPSSDNAPTQQATDILFSNITAEGFDVVSTPGNGDGRLYVVHSGSAVDEFPVDGVTYSPGDNLGGGNIVIDEGTVEGLSSDIVQHVRVFEYADVMGTRYYNRDSAIGNPASQRTELLFDGISANPANSVYDPKVSLGHITYRDQKVLDETIMDGGVEKYVMMAMQGNVGSDPGLRVGIVVWYAPVAGFSHNWTLQETIGGSDEYILKSDTGSWDTNIDCFMCWRADDGQSWHALYGDFSAGKVGYAYRNSPDLGLFTKHGSNPIIDMTGSNRYLRHISRPYETTDGKMKFLAEVREGAANNPGVTDRWIGKLTIDIGDFPGVTADWTLSSVIKAGDYGDHQFRYVMHMMPDLIRVQRPNGDYRYHMCWQTSTQDGSIVRDFNQAGTGVYMAYSDDEMETWTVYTNERYITGQANPTGHFDQSASEEFSFMWIPSSRTMHLYKNGHNGGGEAASLSIGYCTLSKGVFDDTREASFFEDNFDGVSIDTAKWTVTSPTGGLSSVQRRGKIAIISDGSQNTSLTKMLESKVAINSIDDVEKELAFNIFFKQPTTGGDVRVRLGNAAGTRYVEIGKGTALKTLTFNSVGVTTSPTTYSEVFTYFSRFKIKMTFFGPFVCVGEEVYNDPTGRLGAWVNRLSGTGSKNGTSINTQSWPSEDLYISIWASNVSGTATECVINDLQLTHGHVQLHDSYQISDIVSEEQQEAVFNAGTLTAGEQTTIETAISRLILHDGALTVGKFPRSMWWNIDAIWWKRIADATAALTDLKSGRVDTNNGTTHDSDGHTFGGSANIAVNFNPTTHGIKYALNNALIQFYIKTIGTLGANRGFYSATTTTNQHLRIYYANSGTTMRSRVNGGSSNDGTWSSTPANDDFYAFARISSLSGGLKAWKDGSALTLSGGAVSGALPNENITEGSDAALANPLTGTKIGLRVIGGPDGYDAALANTIFRETLLA